MAKNDNDQDETPIQFYIPSGRRGARIPIPINQPHWKYARGGSSKSGVVEWIVIISFLLLSLSILIMEILDSNFWSPIFIISIIMTAISSLFVVLTITQDRNYRLQQKAEKKTEPEKEKEVRHPKRRKDYK